MEFIINGEKIKNEKDFHVLCKNSLDFPDYYGENLDAFWDVMYPLPFEKLHIKWRNASSSKIFLGKNMEKILDIFDRIKEKQPNFSYELID